MSDSFTTQLDRDNQQQQAKQASRPDAIAKGPGKAPRSVQRYGQSPVQAKSDSSAPAAGTEKAADAPTLVDMFGGTLAAVQKIASGPESGDVHAAASEGVSGAGQSLPHGDAIQNSFGDHDVSSVRAHVGGAAAKANTAMGAEAFATGNQVAFKSEPTLHTAAHEAAHVVQQRAGVQLEGGVGQAGDSYESHADAVADRVVAGKDASDLLGPSSAGGSAAVQCKIVENYSSWLGDRAPTKALMKTYFEDFEIMTEYKTVESYCTDDGLIATAKAAVKAATAAARAAATPPTALEMTALKGLLDKAVTAINAALDVSQNLPNKYDKTADDNWDNEKKALGGLNALPVSGTRKPQSKDMPEIPELPWSTAKAGLPVGLRRLLRDIYASWHAGGTLDNRSAKEVQDKTITSNNEGAMRSWHLNARGSLPAASDDATPANATAMEKHYKDTSKKPGNVDSDTDSPIGFVEYTGAGILNDSHNSKVVLDYKRGGVYLTVTHYQLWSTPQQDKFEVHGQNAQDGQKNPWFYIDMQA